MVKKIIESLLKKKNSETEEKKDESEDDIPDELPPLAEDDEGSEPAAKGESKEENAKSENDEKNGVNFDDLTNDSQQESIEDTQNKTPLKIDVTLDDSKSKGEESEGGIESEEESTDDVSEEKSVKEDDSNSGFIASIKKKTVKPQIKTETVKEVQKSPVLAKKENEIGESEEEGFFKELLRITQNQGISEEFFNQDLYSKMKDYWFSHSKKGLRNENKDRIKSDVVDTLANLKKLEERWLSQKKFLEEDKRILLEKEHEIKQKTRELQKLIRQHRMYEDVHPLKFFLLSNGLNIRSVSELLGLLEIIDEKTFREHVNEHKNDFATWISHTVCDCELARRVGRARSREELIFVLQNALLGNFNDIDESQMLKLRNGKRIKTVLELVNELKAMDHMFLEYYIKEGKTEIVNWLRHKLNSNFLANRVEGVSQIDELIDVLERFS